MRAAGLTLGALVAVLCIGAAILFFYANERETQQSAQRYRALGKVAQRLMVRDRDLGEAFDRTKQCDATDLVCRNGGDDDEIRVVFGDGSAHAKLRILVSRSLERRS